MSAATATRDAARARTSENYLRTVLNTAPIGILVIGGELENSFMNARISQFLDSAPVLNDVEALRMYLDPADRHIFEELRAKVANGETATYSCRLELPQLGLRNVQIVAAPAIDDNGQHTGTVVIVRDMNDEVGRRTRDGTIPRRRRRDHRPRRHRLVRRRHQLPQPGGRAVLRSQPAEPQRHVEVHPRGVPRDDVRRDRRGDPRRWHVERRDRDGRSGRRAAPDVGRRRRHPRRARSPRRLRRDLSRSVRSQAARSAPGPRRRSRRADRAAEPPAAVPSADQHHRRPRANGRDVLRPRRLQGRQRQPRPLGRRPLVAGRCRPLADSDPWRRHRRPSRWRRVPGRVPQHRHRSGSRGDRRSPARRGEGADQPRWSRARRVDERRCGLRHRFRSRQRDRAARRPGDVRGQAGRAVVAWRCSTRRCAARSTIDSTWSASCAPRSATTSCRCTTNRSSTPVPARCSASRRWCGGSTRRAA